jgi:hypothetical protein
MQFRNLIKCPSNLLTSAISCKMILNTVLSSSKFQGLTVKPNGFGQPSKYINVFTSFFPLCPAVPRSSKILSTWNFSQYPNFGEER